ncbi:hypothetical protein CKY02_19530 [Photorhabdus bodei]|uniref:Uncharacterized protein n=1 Tax=Photorhabdus bodei TaxID=2029681 RepID=A0A329WUH2_9GAMM|nr:hypothetical protein CKY02_19530 [Photorhabdus bodei]
MIAICSRLISKPHFFASEVYYQSKILVRYIPVIFQVASLLAALTHPGLIVIYAPGDSLLCRRDAS